MIRVVKEEKSSNIITPSDIEDLYKNYGLELEEGPVIYIPYGAPSMGLDDYAPGLFEGIYSVCSAIDDNDEVKEIVEKMFGKMIDDWYPALKIFKLANKAFMLNIDDPNELTQKWKSGFDGTKSYDKSFISEVDAIEYGTMAARYIMLKYPSNFGLTDEDIRVIKYLNAAEKKLDSYDIEEDEQYISLLGILEENGIEV